MMFINSASTKVTLIHSLVTLLTKFIHGDPPARPSSIFCIYTLTPARCWEIISWSIEPRDLLFFFTFQTLLLGVPILDPLI
jgi:hypothetical protein